MVFGPTPNSNPFLILINILWLYLLYVLPISLLLLVDWAYLSSFSLFIFLLLIYIHFIRYLVCIFVLLCL